jgi:hypothetical protein
MAYPLNGNSVWLVVLLVVIRKAEDKGNECV